MEGMEKVEKVEVTKPTVMQILPGITHIYQIRNTALIADIAYRAEAGLPVPMYRTPLALPILGGATWELTEQDDNNSQIEKVTLTFRSTHRVTTSFPSAFIVRTVAGEVYLIGTRERPYPTVKVSRSSGEPDGSASVYEVQVSFTHRRALIKCVM